MMSLFQCNNIQNYLKKKQFLMTFISFSVSRRELKIDSNMVCHTFIMYINVDFIDVPQHQQSS